MGTVPVPYSPTAGDDATQARVLTWADSSAWLLGSATSGGSRRPLCQMRQTVAQSLATGTLTAITFDAEDVDYDNGHSTSVNTSRYTAQTAGWHQVSWTAAFAANATGVRFAWLRKTGVLIAGGEQVSASSAFETLISGSLLCNLNVADYLELVVEQTSGVAVNTAVTIPQQSVMTVEWRSN